MAFAGWTFDLDAVPARRRNRAFQRVDRALTAIRHRQEEDFV